MRSIFTFLLPLVLLAGTAHAEGLAGRILSCRYESVLGFGTVNTTFQFVNGANGQALAIVSSDLAGKEVKSYRLVGSKLTIEDSNAPISYDISNPNAIVRAVRGCVMPGEGGGDSKPACESAAELCVLR